ncbi:hypothetical protein CVT26_007669 [Gymnopilus dilepis]|uniref:Aminoglycoside phosphotransferase domain-containing protein n=1 Tax=Gymnopilus dilepis TaxID=231916 RepID=A0A409W852_9AGAR|nr:hypothetical protein CVT26_007669 [Gymnopilus dilepis]
MAISPLFPNHSALDEAETNEGLFSDYYEPWWSATSVFTPDQDRSRPPVKVDLLSAIVYEKLGKNVKTIKFLDNGVFHAVYEILLDNGEIILSRIAFNFRDTERGRAAVSTKMKQELAVLRLIKDKAPTVPVPAIFYADPDPHNALGAPFMLMEKLPGRSAMYSNLKGIDKESFVRSLARVYVGVFEITLPKIGSLLDITSTGELIMGPVIDEREEFPGGPFDTVHEYLEWLLSSTLVHPRNKSQSPNVDLKDLFSRLSSLSKLLLPPDPNQRFSLVHLDPHERNLLVEGSAVTGLIDWEAHASMPTYLAARYPVFLRNDGIFDDRYKNHEDSELSDGSDTSSEGSFRNDMRPEPFVTPAEVQKLREVFLETARLINPEYVEALQGGERLRQLVEWLAFAEWEGPWVWKGCDLWERDVRSSI